MGSLGDDCNGDNKAVSEDPVANLAPAPPTHPFDSQSLPSPIPGEKGGDVNELQFLQCTLPFEDTIPVEDAFDTQVVNLGGQTQVLDDLDWCKNTDTQLIDEFDDEVAVDSDGEGTDKTEVLDDGDELSDVELGSRGKSQSLDKEKIRESLCEGREKGSMEQSNGLRDEQLSLGSVRRFTSVRVESLRASGLAARSSASQGANSDTCSPLTDGQISQQSTINTNGSKPNISEEAQEFRNRERSKILCPTVRKLFTENSFIETVGHSDNNIDTLAGKELPTCDDGLAGLSYIDSQEPGDLSQSNALACVQKLIDENKVLFDKEIEQGRSSIRKSQHASAAKGAQSLAKKTNVRGINGKTGIYDWDDVHEDEGGGDIFCRRKEEFLGSENLGQRSFMKPRKPKGNRFGGFRDNEGKENQQNEITVHSESKIALCNIKLNAKNVQETEMNVRKNLVNEFDQQSNADISAQQLDATLMRTEIPEMLNVGLDTQIAAEAMEALFHGEGIANDWQGPPVDLKDSMERLPRGKAKRSVGSTQHFFSNGEDTEVATRQSKKTLKRSARSDKQSSISSQKRSKNAVKEFDRDVAMTRIKRVRSGVELEEFGRSHGTASRACRSVNKQDLPKELTNFTPIAHRTRRSSVVSQLRSAESVSADCGEETAGLVKVGGLEQTNAGTIDVEASKLLNGRGKSSELGSSQPGEPEVFKSKLTSANGEFSFPRRTRSLRKIFGQRDEPHNLDGQCQSSYQSGSTIKSVSGHKRSRSNAGVLVIALQSNSGLCAGTDFNANRKTRSPISVCPDFSPQHVDKPSAGGTAFNCNSDDNGKMMSNNRVGAEAVKLSDRSKANSLPSSEIEVNAPTSDKLLKEKTKSACTSPDVCLTPVNAASPVCIGSGYKKSCRKNLSRSCLMKEIDSLCGTRPEAISEPKDSRRRRDLSNVRVLFSHHLDDDILKQQRKIVIRLKLSIASSITDATHFVTDKFVRTRNMLEAIASGKPVVTHLWLENVGRVNYYIDEQKYILRDMKKEKEFGFNLPVSLAHARQRPLLLGFRALITPNTKPDKETVSSLVKAVHGQAVERVSRSTLKDDAVPDDLLILSSELDYEFCVPFLEKGAAVYSSELLLNGIVTQKLEYERHRLFADHVKRTRSTIWMKRDGHNFTPVIKHK